MKWIWFIPVWLVIGAWGSRVAWKERLALGGIGGGRNWLWLLMMAWIPLLCWAAAQFIVQD